MLRINKAVRGVGAIALALAGSIGTNELAFAEERAQDGAGESGSPRRKVEEVTVTAQKYQQNQQDVPISMSTFSAADIRSKSIDGFKDLAQFVPNLTFSNHSTSGDSGAVVFMRGIGQIETLPGNDSGVGMYLDGIYMGRMQGLDLDLLNIERVEILRGPQGTLFGKNTVGGAINVISQRPGHEPALTTELTVGRFNRLDGKISVDLPIVPGKLAAKLVAASRNRDGYAVRRDYSTGAKIDEQGDVDSLLGRAMLEWIPDDSWNVLLSVDASKSRAHANPYHLVATNPAGIASFNATVEPDFNDSFIPADDDTSFGTGPNKSYLDTLGTSAIVSWALGEWTVKSLTSYREVETLFEIDPDGSPYPLLHSWQISDQNQFSQEILFTGSSFNDRLQSVLGLYYFEEEAFSDRPSRVFSSAPPAFGVAAGTWSIASESVFMNGTFHLTDSLSLTGGIRFTTEDRKDQRSGLRDDSDAVTGRLGFEYHWTDEVMSYVSAARGFKSGGFTIVTTGVAVPYDPEYVWTYEVGVKSEFFDDQVRLNTAVFYSDYTDIQFSARVPHPTLGVISIRDNAAEAKIKGFEMELATVPFDGFNFSLGIGYTDAEYVSIVPGTLILTKDSKFVETPEWSYSTSGEYSIPLGDSSNLIARLDYAYRTETSHDVSNNPLLTQDDYGILNARLTYENIPGDWSVSLFGTNLTDERYILGGIDLRQTLGWASVQYSRPREWGLTLKKAF